MKGVKILMWNREEKTKAINGYLYNGYAVSDANFAPVGWHVPTKAELDTLASNLGGQALAGGPIKETGTTYWNSPNTGATNSSGFTAYGSGSRTAAGNFSNILNEFDIWSTTLSGSNQFFYLALYNETLFWDGTFSRAYGHSVRLIKDDSTDPGSITDKDGNPYDTVKINTQVWTVQNWKCTKLNDGTALTNVTSSATWAAAGAGDLYFCAYDNDEDNV